LLFIIFHHFQYKVADGGRWNNQVGSTGSKDLPSIKIEELLPNTEYEAKIAIYEDYSLRNLGKSTGIISVTTESTSSKNIINVSSFKQD
jgi:hypothetical protein